jgi:hypothetical protein
MVSFADRVWLKSFSFGAKEKKGMQASTKEENEILVKP